MFIRGKVKKGKGRGKEMGFPTANIALQKKIQSGIYISKTKVNGKNHNSLTFIGDAKTFNESTYQAETYLLDFNEDLYNKWIGVELIKKIRDNQKFESSEELIEAMNGDVKEALNYFNLKSSRT